MKAFLIWLLAAFAAPPAAAPPAQQQMSGAEAAAVHQAAERGALIYAYDQAAWHGTDDLAAKMPDYQTRVGGWIVDGPAEAPELVFFDKNEADPQALFVADFRDNRLVSSKVLGPADSRTLSPARKALIAALRTAKRALVQSGFKACKPELFNSVVLPPAKAGDPILIYFLTPQTVTQSVPFGGHYLFEIGPDGKVVGQRRFTNTCLEMPLNPPDGAKSAGIGVTHLLDPVPTEIHVFTSLTTHLPVFVATASNKHLWKVDGSAIGIVTWDIAH
ncbi:MAG TPA: hypothetical protein VH331_17265 [Allosphingosinicella sp.]|jgi:hypothetical protein|nr:hypothetical protein [Allosphingosinicella sp.]